MEERIDKLVLQRQLVTSRARAEQMIREHGVRVDGKIITKTGKKVPIDATIELLVEDIPWVSRGALKLLHALDYWQIAPKGCYLDLGSSTGGFTEVLLSKNVEKVIAIDVGSNQMHPKLRQDERIALHEQTHIRDLTHSIIPNPVEGCVIDLSFISLTKVFPFIHPFLADNATVIALVKPQFEVGKENLNKGGIVKNKLLFKQVLEQVKMVAEENNLVAIEYIDSPILGGDGNHEFLFLLKKERKST
jgi:23S rRNA (cytidine1920-2'-O)/16S rRNA (cytidine1409-2'-O)-methyltransferase